MKTAACFLFHIPARFIHAPGFTFWPATSAWSLWRRLTAARRYSRCCGTKSTLRKKAESAPLRASAEDRARAHAMYGDMFTEDPSCIYRPTAQSAVRNVPSEKVAVKEPYRLTRSGEPTVTVPLGRTVC